MSKNIIGFVAKLNVKKGTSRKGKPYTLYSMRLTDKSGEEIDAWFQCAFDKPECQEGDYIQVPVTARDDGNYDVVVNGIKVSKNPPANPSAKKRSAGGGTKASGTPTSDLFGEIGGYNTEDDIRRMSYTAARSHALEAVGLLLEHGGLKLVKADTKAGTASRFDLITEAIDKLTIEYYFDAAGGRKLETVSDSFEATPEGDGPLPDAEGDAEELDRLSFEDEAEDEFAQDEEGDFDDEPEFD
jgi:hypothetical protein